MLEEVRKLLTRKRCSLAQGQFDRWQAERLLEAKDRLQTRIGDFPCLNQAHCLAAQSGSRGNRAAGEAERLTNVAKPLPNRDAKNDWHAIRVGGRSLRVYSDGLAPCCPKITAMEFVARCQECLAGGKARRSQGRTDYHPYLPVSPPTAARAAHGTVLRWLR